jgi:hypothetical protein
MENKHTCVKHEHIYSNFIPTMYFHSCQHYLLHVHVLGMHVASVDYLVSFMFTTALIWLCFFTNGFLVLLQKKFYAWMLNIGNDGDW